MAAIIAGILDRPDLVTDATHLHQPVWLLDGAEDQRCGAAARTASAEAFPAAQRGLLPGLGHMALIEDPAAVARWLTAQVSPP